LVCNLGCEPFVITLWKTICYFFLQGSQHKQLRFWSLGGGWLATREKLIHNKKPSTASSCKWSKNNHSWKSTTSRLQLCDFDYIFREWRIVWQQWLFGWIQQNEHSAQHKTPKQMAHWLSKLIFTMPTSS
jgi:hypothetical protein